MKAKCILLLPVFLCSAFLFRMCFLSFGSIYSPIISYHAGIGFKRKVTHMANDGSPEFKNYLTGLRKAPMSELQASKSRGIFNKKLSVSTLLFLSSCVVFLYALFSIPKTNSPDLSDKYCLTLDRHIIFSILRIWFFGGSFLLLRMSF